MGAIVARSKSRPDMTMPEAAMLGAESILHRHATVVEYELTGLAAAKAHLAELLRDGEAGRIALDDEGRYPT
jgi:hypothetical protein